MIWELKDELSEALKRGLPGAKAHRRMIPAGRVRREVYAGNGKPPVQSAVLVLLYPTEEGELCFPLIQRPKYNGAHSAQVSLPGGKAEPQDTDLIQTALREAHEEIGIDTTRVEVLGQLTDVFIPVSNFIVSPIVGITGSEPELIKDDVEVESIIVARLHDLFDPARRKEGTVVARGKYKINTPYFDINSRVVWGATAMMLSELSDVLSKTNIYK